jgi:hypothetical protein
MQPFQQLGGAMGSTDRRRRTMSHARVVLRRASLAVSADNKARMSMNAIVGYDGSGSSALHR